MDKGKFAPRNKLILLDQALSDKAFHLVGRPQSRAWGYEGVLGVSLAGFNPLTSSAFYASDSQLALWLKNPDQPLRPLNESSFLIRELSFALHDYLHCWAYRAINELMPKLGFGTQKITSKNFEDFAFCHILTETTATIGLDYWYLSTFNLNKTLDVGTKFRTLTVGYHEDDKAEYLRFNPKMNVQSKDFFKKLNDFYCSGIFLGFSINDLRQSSMTFDWLRHEIRYGEDQRRYSRLWLRYLSGEKIVLSKNQLEAPISTKETWKKGLVSAIGDLLWDKVKNNKREIFSFQFDQDKIWKNEMSIERDFRFVNLNMLNPKKAWQTIPKNADYDTNFQYFFFQYVSQFQYETFDRELRKLFPELLRRKDFKLIEYLFKDQKRVEGLGKKEPFNLFLLN